MSIYIPFHYCYTTKMMQICVFLSIFTPHIIYSVSFTRAAYMIDSVLK